MIINLTPTELFEIISTQRDLIVKLTEKNQNHVKILD